MKNNCEYCGCNPCSDVNCVHCGAPVNYPDDVDSSISLSDLRELYQEQKYVYDADGNCWIEAPARVARCGVRF